MIWIVLCVGLAAGFLAGVGLMILLFMAREEPSDLPREWKQAA